ncbi:hypothetical protein [Marinobacter sp.]|uniref:hypothetical protein n=1 Tax=Marinobacter sp. TaxID=50741 RepID=UPI0035684094
MPEQSLIQATEKMLGREPPMPRSERIAKEERDEMVAEAIASTKAQLAAEKSGTSPEVFTRSSEGAYSGNGAGESLTGSFTVADASDPLLDIFDGGREDVLIGASAVLAFLVIGLSFVVFRLSRRNKRMRESSMFSTEVLGNLGQNETVLWLHRKSKRGKEYRAFLADFRKLAKEHQEKSGVEFTLTEGRRDD